jgi:hypothetical protein
MTLSARGQDSNRAVAFRNVVMESLGRRDPDDIAAGLEGDRFYSIRLCL